MRVSPHNLWMLCTDFEAIVIGKMAAPRKSVTICECLAESADLPIWKVRVGGVDGCMIGVFDSQAEAVAYVNSPEGLLLIQQIKAADIQES
jgi:hypothetical protein